MPLITANRKQLFDFTSQRRTWPMFALNRLNAAILLMIAISSGCARPMSSSPAITPSASVPNVSITRVRVSPENGIFITGTTNLPNAECVQTELLANGEAEPWWPRDLCVQVDSGLWELLVPLGRRGAPPNLDTDAQYEVKAWWPTQPDVAVDNLHFDLSGPQEPE